MKTKLTAIFLVLMGIILWNCTDEPGTSENGRMRLQLTDAPFAYDLISEANVTIYKIEARYAGEDDDNMDDGMDSRPSGDDDDDGKSFVTLFEEELDVNLLDLTNGVTETLVDTEVPAGEYDLIRVYVKGVNVVMKDSTVFDLKVPSGEQTGIKVFIDPPLVVAGGLSADLLLDFDVSRSFVARGNIRKPGFNGFIFKPVIKVSNLTTAGTLAGNVFTTVTDSTGTTTTPGLEGAQVALIVADTVNTSTLTDADGNYMVMGLEPGAYNVEVQLEGYETQTAEGVTIVVGNKTIQDFELVPNP
ncbi:DUF4382 domain-containing protein [Lentiprolixibacter aurantiacus]|uniref:DUF4382 domain-containing protein n=1 Tax=Lentiprolixibacter aurantiacus TaxID=2993939 RepID=A0AAE3SNC6_9FLAO|nr:DUF4382 domain-containing protein [Lentiprolixibacter aurantiacus]MCX2719622.1 DUF4382 domain-containing protein [Lentiprolixibacter aurantiacus]